MSINKKNYFELNKNELRFLYELDEKIVGFGYRKDPRAVEIRQQRSARNDLSIANRFQPHEISLTDEEALKGGIRYHFGNLKLYGLQSPGVMVLPQSIGGDLDLSSLQTAEGLVLPDRL